MKRLFPLWPYLVLLAVVVGSASWWIGGSIYNNMGSVINVPPSPVEQPRTVSLDDTDITIELKKAPSSESNDYDGIGVPTILITYVRNNGSLNRIHHYSEILPVSTDGIDVCQSRIVYDSYYILYPTVGATTSTSNVTYASDTYGSVNNNGPGGSRCVLRANTHSIWDVLICMEGDGRLDPLMSNKDSIIVFDTWDVCISFRLTIDGPVTTSISEHIIQ